MNKLILPILIFFCISFVGPKTDFREYYFPFDQFKEPKVYKYVDANDNKNTVYWRLSTEKRKSGTYFVTRAYDNNRDQIEFFEEKITSEGLIVTNFTEIYDTKNQKKGRIDKNQVYMLKSTKSYVYKIYVDSGKYIFEKKRTPTDKKITKSFNGKNYDCIIMDDLYITRNIENEDQFYDYNQETYYAKGIGIIGYKRFLPDGTICDYKLSQIIYECSNFKIVK